MLTTRLLIAALASAFIASCASTTDPGDDPGTTPGEITFTPVTDLPKTGGNVTHVGVLPGGALLVLIDGRIHTMTSATAAPQPAGPSATYLAVGVSPAGEVYGITSTEIHSYDALSSTPRVVPIDPAGPLSTNGRVEAATVVFAQSGEPYITMTSNYPRYYVYHSTDKGASWDDVNNPNSQFTTAFAIAPDGTMHLASSQAYYTSTDQGTTWQSKGPVVQNYSGTMRIMSDGTIYYWLPQAGSLHVSRNGGSSFTQLSEFNRAPFFVDIQEAPSGGVYALVTEGGQLTPQQPTKLVHSADGTLWTTVLYGNGRALSVMGQTIMVGLAGSDGRNGGIYVSTNSGGTWTSTGIRDAAAVNDMAFDRNGNLLALIDNTLYRRTTSGWNVIGSQGGNFSRIATSGQSIAIASPYAVYTSRDDAASWSQHSITDFIGGRGLTLVPAFIGRSNGEFLMSLMSYENPGIGYHAGVLYRIGADGIPKRVTGSAAQLLSLVEDRNGTLYGVEQFLDGISQTYRSITYESSDGSTWTALTRDVRSGLSYNSANRYVRVGSTSGLILGTTRGGEDGERTTKGYTDGAHLINRLIFAPDDRLYLAPMAGGLYVSTAAVR